MEKGKLRTGGPEVFRYLDPDVEWNTAFAGISFRSYLASLRAVLALGSRRTLHHA